MTPDRSCARLLGAACLFVAFASPAAQAASPPPWSGVWIGDYQGGNAAQLATLRSIGVSALKVLAQREGDVHQVVARAAPARAAGLQIYIENIATDFYAAYHRWTPDHPVNWTFTEAQTLYRANPDSMAPLMRAPSLSDPVWLKRITDRLAEHVRIMHSRRPLYYDLADEPGIADLAAFWDFDFSPVSLDAFRGWLRTQYGSLFALNAEWGTHYADWADVRPWTTREAMAAPPGNLAPWTDFKAFMDVAFARAVQAGTDAIHRADPDARSGLEGAQVPGWGGYDYALLSQTVDVMEPYDSDENLALLENFNPHVLPLLTTNAADPHGLHTLWQEWLRGVRGVVIWDENPTLTTPDGRLTARGAAYKPAFAALTGRPGRTLSQATPVYDPVAILYSPASFRVEWMFENRPAGDAWMHSDSEKDGLAPVRTRTALTAYAGTLAHLGLRPRYLSDAGLAAGPPRGVRLLILPHQVALSGAELRALRAFSRAGGTVVTDSEIGQTDLHGRDRPGGPVHLDALRVPPGDRAGMEAALHRAGIAPAFPTDATDVQSYVYRLGSQHILALQRDLGAPSGGEETVTVTLKHPMHVTDLLSGTPLGVQHRVTVRLGPVTPSVLVLR